MRIVSDSNLREVSQIEGNSQRVVTRGQKLKIVAQLNRQRNKIVKGTASKQRAVN